MKKLLLVIIGLLAISILTGCLPPEKQPVDRATYDFVDARLANAQQEIQILNQIIGVQERQYAKLKQQYNELSEKCISTPKCGGTVHGLIDYAYIDIGDNQESIIRDRIVIMFGSGIRIDGYGNLCDYNNVKKGQSYMVYYTEIQHPTKTETVILITDIVIDKN